MTTENIKETIQAFRKDRRFDLIITRMAGDEHFRTALLHEISCREYPYPEYASWIAHHYFKQHIEQLQQWIPFVRKVLLETDNTSVQRNLANLFHLEVLPVSEDGVLLDLFLSFLESADAPPALKHAALRSIEKQFFPAYPELIPEIGQLLFLHQEDRRPSIESMRRNYRKNYKSFTHA